MSKNPFYTKMVRLTRWFVTFLHPLRVVGRENVPAEPVVLCANHSSNWDPLLAAYALGEDYCMRIMAKQQLFRTRWLGRFLRRMGVFPVDRGHADLKAMKTAIQTIRDGQSLLVFPEGTRVKDGTDTAAKGGVVMIAMRTGAQLLPVYIGRTKRLFQKVPVIIGTPFSPLQGSRRGRAEEYQNNADEIMRRVYRLGEVK